jgi:site-specific DNA recombinase
MNTSNQLRFAPIIRVSTEKQAAKGESLKTQKKQIESFVQQLGGNIPLHCWRYSGQEHATPEQERQKLKNLLEDSDKDLFDAVIVCDASRWSRDNAMNKRGLNILKQNGIKFFVGTTEYDLYSPDQTFFLSMAVEIGEFQAAQQNQKSLLNKIERAKRGIPTSGKLPYGRIYNPATNTWGIDKEKKKNIEWAAKKYLAGESMTTIAKALGMNISNLHKVLTKRAGADWSINFKSKKFNIKEKVTITIPRLLSEEAIVAIKAKLKANKTYTHGEIKNKYLLSRMIFCDKCGYATFGQVSHSGKRYYRHARDRKVNCNNFNYIPANIIEEAVLVHLFQMFGNKNKMEKAIKEAIPNKKELEQLPVQKQDLQQDLGKNERAMERIIDKIADGSISDAEVSKKLEKLRQQKGLLTAEIEKIITLLENAPSEKHIRANANLLQAQIRSMYSTDKAFSEMGYEEKRNLVQFAFGGTTPDGKRYGVYVEKTNSKKRPWVFKLIGALCRDKIYLPMDIDEKESLLDIEKLNILSKRNAYNSISLY